jgi:hypothetical protein
MTLLAGDLLWLLLDDETGEPLVDKQSLSHALAGALLVDLVAPNRFARVTGPGDTVRAGRLVLLEPVPPRADPLLAHAVELLRHRNLTPKQAIHKLEPGLRNTLSDRLCSHRRVTRQSSRLLGFIPTTVWPTIDRNAKNMLRQPLRRVLLDAHQPDHHTLTLITLLHIIDALPAQCSGWQRRVIDERAVRIREQYTESTWTTEPVRQAICDSNARTYTGGYLIP